MLIFRASCIYQRPTFLQTNFDATQTKICRATLEKYNQIVLVDIGQFRLVSEE